MKSILLSLARYNRSVNEDLDVILRGLDKDRLTADTGTYYHSIANLCRHVLLADMLWLHRLQNKQFCTACLTKNPLMSIDHRALRAEIEADHVKLFERRKQIDALIEECMHEMSDEDCIRALQYTNTAGKEIHAIVWQALIHWFNHQTHHRGNLSAMLDILGIDNDFSSFLSRVK